MHIRPLGTAASGDGLVRQQVEVTYADGAVEALWIAVPEGFAASAAGDAWAVAMLPLGMTLGEDIHLALPVCPVLHRNLGRLQALWRSWYPHLGTVRLEAPVAGPAPPGHGEALFFSGGVDSAYALAMVVEAGGTAPDLLIALGADLGITHHDVFAQLQARYAPMAARYGSRLVPLAANLRETRWARANWLQLSFGPFLVACHHALAARAATVTLASGENPELWPLGAHPGADSFLSTATTSVRHGEQASRSAKLRALGRHPALLAGLRVCWRIRDGHNCGTCEKCVRTMVAAELAGVLRGCRLFPTQELSPLLVRRTLIPPGRTLTSYYLSCWEPLAEEADQQGRSALAAAIRAAGARSQRLNRVWETVQPLHRHPVVWRVPALVDRIRRGGA